MQEQLQIYAATVASAALRHDFVVPLTLIGRNAEFLEELVSDEAIKAPSPSEKSRLLQLCKKASQDSTRVHQLMTAFGREIRPNRQKNVPQRQVQLDILKQFLKLNDEVGPSVSALLNTCNAIYRAINAHSGNDFDATKLAVRMHQSATRAQEMYSGLAHFFRIHDIDETTFADKDLAIVISSIAAAVRNLKTNPSLKDIPVFGLGRAEIIEPQFALIFQNLFQNAAKFTLNRRTPQIEVTIRELRFLDLQAIYPDHFRKYAGRGDWIEINTIDNGAGIDQKYVDKIFNIYFTRDPTNITLGGTGMGLAIAKLVATVHRGVLFLSNNSNPTTFCLAIPKNHRDGISLAALTQLEHALR